MHQLSVQKTSGSWNTWIKIMLVDNFHGFFHRKKANMLKKLLLRLLFLSCFPFYSELVTGKIYSQPACTDLHQHPIKQVSSLLTHLLIQQTQPEVQEFKLFAALFPLLATKYGKWDFSQCSPPWISLHTFDSEHDSNDKQERTQPTLSFLSWLYIVNGNIKQ